MKTLDLHEAIPEMLSTLEDRDEPASVTAVLQALGVLLAPTLRHGGGDEPSPTPGGGWLGRFVLVGELGRGGMGCVLEARDPEIRRSPAPLTHTRPASHHIPASSRQQPKSLRSISILPQSLRSVTSATRTLRSVIGTFAIRAYPT